jgi:hypothetical protein
MAGVTGRTHFFRAMILFRQGKPDEARQLAIAAAATMKPLPTDERNPLAGNAELSDLHLWLACNDSEGLCPRRRGRCRPGTARREMTGSRRSE